jgi:hypothetical protein
MPASLGMPAMVHGYYPHKYSWFAACSHHCEEWREIRQKYVMPADDVVVSCEGR